MAVSAQDPSSFGFTSNRIPRYSDGCPYRDGHKETEKMQRKREKTDAVNFHGHPLATALRRAAR